MDGDSQLDRQRGDERIQVAFLEDVVRVTFEGR